MSQRIVHNLSRTQHVYIVPSIVAPSLELEYKKGSQSTATT